MATDNTNTTKELVQNCLDIDLLQYAQRQGYEIVQGKTSTTFVSLKNKSNGDHIRIKKNVSPMVFTNNDAQLEYMERGNIINFVINRANGMVTSNPKPTGIQFRDAFNQILSVSLDPNFKNNFKTEKSKPRENNNSIDDVKYKIKDLNEVSSYTYNYLKLRNIDENIIHAPIFAGKIKESPVRMANDKVINNIAFVKTDNENKITGFVTHYHSSKDKQNIKRVYELEDNAWKSNVFDNTKHLFFGESAIDCISHYELMNPPNAAYISYEGQTSEKKLNALFDNFMQLQDTQHSSINLISITDNDYQGHVYDLQTAIHFNNKLNFDQPIETTILPNTIKYIFHGHLPKTDLIELKEQMKQYLRLECPQTHNFILPYLNLVQMKDFTIIEIPFKIQTQKEQPFLFLRPLTKAIFDNTNVNFVLRKSNTKDWNEQLSNNKLEIKKDLNNQKKINL